MVRTAAPPVDLPSRIGDLSLSRAAGATHSAATYETLMLACIEHGRPTYAYRLLEEGAADGLRLAILRAELDLPDASACYLPEAETRGTPVRRGRRAAAAARRFRGTSSLSLAVLRPGTENIRAPR